MIIHTNDKIKKFIDAYGAEITFSEHIEPLPDDMPLGNLVWYDREAVIRSKRNGDKRTDYEIVHSNKIASVSYTRYEISPTADNILIAMGDGLVNGFGRTNVHHIIAEIYAVDNYDWKHRDDHEHIDIYPAWQMAFYGKTLCGNWLTEPSHLIFGGHTSVKLCKKCQAKSKQSYNYLRDSASKGAHSLKAAYDAKTAEENRHNHAMLEERRREGRWNMLGKQIEKMVDEAFAEAMNNPDDPIWELLNNQ